MKIYSVFILLLFFTTAPTLLHGVNWRLKNNFSQTQAIPEQQVNNSLGFKKSSLFSSIANHYCLTIGGLVCLATSYQKRPDLINANLFYSLASAYILDRSLLALHEFGHAGMIKLVGGVLRKIEISPLPIVGGGVTRRYVKNKYQFFVSMAGPIAGLTGCYAAYNLLNTLPSGSFNTKAHWAILYWMTIVNLIQCIPFHIPYNPITFNTNENFKTDGFNACQALKQLYIKKKKDEK